MFNTPTTNRRLIDGWPVDWPTTSMKINRQTKQKTTKSIRRWLGWLYIKMPILEKYSQDSKVIN